MSASETSSNPMDELRHVQLLLKREEIFDEFQATEVKELAQNLRSETQKVLFLQKFLIFLQMISMGDKTLSVPTKAFQSLLSASLEGGTHSLSHPVLNSFTKIVNEFSKDLSILAQSVISVLNEYPKFEDSLVYSTLPSFFSSLWNYDAAVQFVKFIQILKDFSHDKALAFSKVIFSIPLFQQFLEAVVCDLRESIPLVVDVEKSNDFSLRFLEKWKENSKLCPNIIKNVILVLGSPEETLFSIFFLPAFQSPFSFQIVPISLKPQVTACQLILQSISNYKHDLWNAIDQVEDSPSLVSSSELTKIVPDSTLIFSDEDLMIIHKLSVAANKIKSDFPTGNEFNPPPGGEYQVVLLTTISLIDSKNVQTEEPGKTVEDDLEFQLRKMLTGVDVIPLAAHQTGDPDMVELLKHQVQLARPEKRLLLEMKIDYFESARKNANRNWTFIDFLSLLRTKFDERMPQRLQKLSRISLHNKEFSSMNSLAKSLEGSIDKIRNILRYHLIAKWLTENPIEVSQELYTSPSSFGQFFDTKVKNFVEWTTSKGYQQMNTNVILHNLVMRELPLEQFIAANPRIDEEDKEIYTYISTQKDDILQKNTFAFTSAFQENPRLLDDAQRFLHSAFSSPLPLEKSYYFSQALHNLVFVLTFEGHKDVGADEWLPMTILLMVHHGPKQLASTIEYITHFLMKLADPPFNSKLIDDNAEYTFTMVSSAKIHFSSSQ